MHTLAFILFQYKPIYYSWALFSFNYMDEQLSWIVSLSKPEVNNDNGKGLINPGLRLELIN